MVVRHYVALSSRRAGLSTRSRPCLIALALTLGLPVASAQELFNAAETLPTGGTPVSAFTNYIVLVDLDGDGDLDIIAPNCSGFMGTGAQTFEVYANDGNGVFSSYGFPLGGTKAVRQVAVGDIDNDGDIDVYVPDAANGPHLLFLNDGNGVFTEVSATHLPPGMMARTGAARFADVDNDGDLDLFVGNAYATGGAGPIQGHILLNDGNGVFTPGPTMPTGPGADPIDIDFADVDRDWDLDIVLNMHLGKSLLWLNDGTGAFSDATQNVHAMEGFHYGPSLCDIDGDGDLDMWTDNAGPGLADILATNDGMGVFSDMTASLVSGNPGNADDNGVVCVDIDQDGDMDATVVSLSTRERVLVNTNGTFQYVPDKFPASSLDNSLWMDFGDLNGDGRLDAVTAQGEPSAPNKVFLANANMPIDTQPPTIIRVEEVGAPDEAATPVVRFAVSDAAVTDVGPRLSRAYVKVTGDKAQEVEARFSGGDIFRAVLPAFADGTVVIYSACAVDIEGNEACSAALSYTVGRPITSGVGGGGAGGEGAGGTSAGGAGPGATTGAGGSDDDDDDGDEGCGCRTAGAPGQTGWALALFGLAGFIARRRRR